MKLTTKQIEEIKQEVVDEGSPVRFLVNGQALEILSGDLLPKHTNIMYHPVYWNFTKETSKKIAKWLNAKPVFCD
jgi:mannitol-1-phosphate/altronate dehydrogenase